MLWEKVSKVISFGENISYSLFLGNIKFCEMQDAVPYMSVATLNANITAVINGRAVQGTRATW